jgi:Protein of unknown function (DUF3025)
LTISHQHTNWQHAQTALSTPFFEAIRPSLIALDANTWPSIAALNALALANHIHHRNGLALQFVAAEDSIKSAMQYEGHIAATGEIPTRDVWHDLFNALQWLNFPLLKSTTNQLHNDYILRGNDAALPRSPQRDVLTMFDESGIIVASADSTLLQLIRDFQWRTLFVTRREDVIRHMRFRLSGHGLLEKSLSPFIGITAKAMLLHINDDDTNLDQHAADWLSVEANLSDSRNLAPLPLLGIPGWDERNEDAAFYDNTQYFRLGRRGDTAVRVR